MFPLFFPRSSSDPVLERHAASMTVRRFTDAFLADPQTWSREDRARAESLIAHVSADTKRAVLREMILSAISPAEAGDYYDRIFFLARDPDIDAPQRTDALRCLIKSKRASVPDVDTLVKAGVNDAAKGNLVLHAAYAGNIDIVKALVSHGADLNQDGRCTVLAEFIGSHALHKADLDIVRLLLDGTDLLLKDKDGEDPLTVAVKYVHRLKEQVLQLILQAGRACNENGMMQSIETAKMHAQSEMKKLRNVTLNLCDLHDDERERINFQFQPEEPPPQNGAQLLSRLDMFEKVRRRNDFYIQMFSKTIDMLDKERDKRKRLDNIYL